MTVTVGPPGLAEFFTPVDFSSRQVLVSILHMSASLVGRAGTDADLLQCRTDRGPELAARYQFLEYTTLPTK